MRPEHGATEYESGKAPAYMATRRQLADKKLVPTDDPDGFVKLKNGRLLALYDWRKSKHSRFADRHHEHGR